MRSLLKFSFSIVIAGLISACGMTDEQNETLKVVYRECSESVKHLDIYEKDGTHFSKTSDGKKFEMRICLARAQLYAEGYRIGKTSNESDWKIYQLSLMSNRSVKAMYKDLIKSGIEP